MSTSKFRILRHTIRANPIRQRPGCVIPGHENHLRLAVKQYIPLDNPRPGEGDVTVIGAHANGFPKELYEPLWDDLQVKLSDQGRKIRSIWIADVAQQGASGVLNEGILGDDPDWFDHARDLLAMIYNFQDRIAHPIIGVGHSMGGMQLAHLSLIHPRLFNGLILLDPVIENRKPPAGVAFARASTSRRDLWPSREDAANQFQRSRFYRPWDPRVLERYVRFGLRDLPTPTYPGPLPASKEAEQGQAVTLTTPKPHELTFYARPSYIDARTGLPRGIPEEDMHPDDVPSPTDPPFYRPEPASIFRRLEEIKTGVFYIFGRDSPLSRPEDREAKMERTGRGWTGSGREAKGDVKEVVLDCGHMVPMERVGETADACAGFVCEKVQLWERDVHKFREGWERVPREERLRIDEQWIERIGAKRKGKL